MSFWNLVVVGERFELGAHHFTAEDIKRFAAKFDPQPFHLDEAAAERSLFGGLCASGWHTASVYMRLNAELRAALARRHVEAGNPEPNFGPSPGIRNLRWLKPVFAGDTVTFRQTVTAKRVSNSRPGWGIAETHSEGVNQDGTTVFELDGSFFVPVD
ncbi:MaoC family dehydratase [Mangrovibrevibacter kandeliae]|uniref:MaoC family dehydratase n=1 Tax=Mangrovibrevibacter kandeliae TaxID=2968473 RepID=UPI0021197A20|nr:MaoC family dehydratase [Aurantimonas sp. CSK15Z-1]MCQ8781015.1 MaoC family dehydratase [Aurantimonas sp. CSK15Z-1]